MYDPTVGQFIEEDPVGFDAGDTNLYRYCGNSPTNARDPSGMASYGPNGEPFWNPNPGIPAPTVPTASTIPAVPSRKRAV